MEYSGQWFNNAIIYQVFVDRFNGFKSTQNTSGFAGGNLRGVKEKLDYLQDLGITVIWLSPFYHTNNYHGYHITDFRRVEPRFGSVNDLEDLISSASKRNIRVIADFVPNHCSAEHNFFHTARNDRSSKYAEWFIFKNWPNDYLCFMDFKELPKINLDNPEARDYMIATADYWLSKGLSGFRIDHVIGPGYKFWKAFKNAIVDKYPDCVFIGEAWASGFDKRLFKTIGIKKKFIRRFTGIPQEKLQFEYNGLLTGALDFYLTGLLVESVGKNINLLTDADLKDKIEKHLSKVPKGYTMVSFLDNHDMDRFLRHCKGDVNKLLEAFELLFSLNLPVVIYNGTEACTYNKKSVRAMSDHSDLAVREPIDWNGINDDFVEGFKNLVSKYKKASSSL